MQIMGVILVAAMLVVPVAAAAQVARGFSESLLVSVVLAELAVVLGIGVSYYAEATAGGVIVLVAVVIYVGSVVAGKLLGRGAGDASTAEVGAITVEGTERSD
jgi:zinc transport system permease protein